MKPSRRRARTAHRHLSVSVQSLEQRCLLSIGELDPSYGEGGIAHVQFTAHSSGVATAVEALPDGRSYVAAFDSLDFSLARLTLDGELDPTFGTGGQTHVHLSGPFQADQPTDMAVQPDGKIIVGGIASSNFGLVRFLPNGTLDPSFGNGGVVITPAASFAGATSAVLRGLVLQPDGRIVALGNSSSRGLVARYKPDGTVDPAFGFKSFDLATRLGQPTSVTAFTDGLLSSDGSLFLSGFAYTAVLTKLTANGNVDTTFADRGVAHDATFFDARAIAAAPLGGFYTVVATSGNYQYNAAVAHWNADGTVDRSFGNSGSAALTTGFFGSADIRVQPDGSVTATAGVSRWSSGGSSNGFEWATFSPEGQRLGGNQWINAGTYASGGSSIALQPDGRALFVGGGGRPPDDVPLVFRYRTMADGPKGATLDAGVVFVTGDEGANDLSISRDVTQWLILLDGQSFTFPASAASRVDTRLLGGNDYLTIGPDVPPGMVDLGDGDDTADLRSSVRKGLVGGKGNDTFGFGARAGPSTAVALEPGEGDDVVQAIGTDAADSFSLLNGALELPGWHVNFNADLEKARMEAGGGDDSVTVDILPSPAGSPDPFGPAAVVDGGDGNDTFVTHRGPGGRLQEFHGGPGDDRMNVFPEYRTLVAFEAGTGDDRVTFGQRPLLGSLTLTNNQVTSTSGQSLTLLDPPAVEGLEIDATETVGEGDYYVVRTAPGIPTTILGGPGLNTFASSSPFPALANITFDGGGDPAWADTVDLSDPAPGSHDFIIGAANVTRDGVSGPRYTRVNALSLRTGDGGNHITIADVVGLSSVSVSGGRGDDVFDTAPAPTGLGAKSGATITLSGRALFSPSGSGADLFRIRPDANAKFSVWGDAPKPANPPTYNANDLGDRLEVDATSAGGADLSVLGRGYGRYTFADRQPVQFFDIESVNDIASAVPSDVGFHGGPPQSVTFAFTGDVSGSVSTDDLKLSNLTTGHQVEPANWPMSFGAGGTTVTFTFDHVPGGHLPGGRYRATLPAGSVAVSSPSGPVPLATNLSTEFNLGPSVTGVWVDGTRWGAPFRDRLRAAGLVSADDASLGFPIDPATQSASLPWANIDRFSARFDAPVDADVNDLYVLNSAGSYSVARAFAYDPQTYTATWTLALPPRNDRVRFQLIGAVSSGIALAGTSPDRDHNNPPTPVLLDGEYNGTFPSGDGKPGGNFVFALNLLTGDATRDGRVDAADLLRVRSHLGTSAGQGVDDVFCDLNADGRVNALDIRQALASQSHALPAAPTPAAQAPASPFRRASHARRSAWEALTHGVKGG